MSASKQAGRSGRRARVIHVTPITRAVRHALAVSATALALAGPAAAAGAAPCAPATVCAPALAAAQAPVVDLTVVRGPAVSAVVAPSSVQAAAGDVTVTNTDPRSASATYNEAAVAWAVDVPADVLTVDNSGQLDATAERGMATGLQVTASGALDLRNSGVISASSRGPAEGIAVTAGGLVSLVNHGDITVQSGGGEAKYGPGPSTGIRISGDVAGVPGLLNYGTLDVSADGDAAGIRVDSIGDAAVVNAGGISVSSRNFSANGLLVTSREGAAQVGNVGTVDVSGNKYANGLTASAYGGDAVAVNGGDIVVSGGRQAAGVSAESALGSATVYNDGTLVVDARGTGYGPVVPLAAAGETAALGLSARAGATATVGNSGHVEVTSEYGDAIGLDARGDVARADNTATGSIYAASYYGLADGIFATGRDVGATNAGDIAAWGYAWAAGIEAQGDEVTTVDNSGTILADAWALAEGGPYGQASGIFATAGAGGLTVTNTGSITATGVYAAGIDATSAGSLSITHGGDITAGFGRDTDAAYGRYYATGIRASTNYDAGDITITSTGTIDAGGVIAATGIDASATGLGSRVSVDNSGDITAISLHPYGSADGIVASGDGDTQLTNSGSLLVSAGGDATGASALSFAGTASLTNTGDIHLQAGANGIGLVAFAQNGAASADNSGLVQIGDGLYAFGAQVGGMTGASLVNTGTLSVSGKYSYGAVVTAGAGDAVLDNGVDALIASNGTVFGLGTAAIATAGDVASTNAGTVYATGLLQAIGAYGHSREGDVGFDNSGTVIAASYLGDATGVIGIADLGTTTLTNHGLVVADSYYGNATALRGEGAGVEVGNAGNVVATAYGDAIGVDARGDVVRVDNTATGSIAAASYYGLADGIFATGTDVGVSNAGDITAWGYAWAAGIEAQGDDITVVDNSGTIDARAYAMAEGGPYGQASGIFATAGAGGLTVTNTGSITATGVYAAGIDATSAGSLSITHGGDITAGFGTDLTAYAGNYYATGIRASTNYDGGDITVASSGTIQAGGIIGAAGIDVAATGLGSRVRVDNTGDIVAIALHPNGSTDGIVAAGDGDTDVTTSGTILALANGDATGASALSFAGTASIANSGGLYVQAGSNGTGTGLVAFAQNGVANAHNSGLVQIDDGLYVFGAQVNGMTGARLDNTGTIETTGYVSYGALVTAGLGDAMVDNGAGGMIDSAGGLAGFGIDVESTAGHVAARNDGTVITSGSLQAIGVYERSREGDVRLDNNGMVAAVSDTTAAAVRSIADLGDLHIVNAGDLVAVAGARAFGVNASAGNGLVDIANSGTVDAVAYTADATAIQGTGAAVAIGNTGTLLATSYYAAARGVDAAGDLIGVDNDGDIAVYGATRGTGILAVGPQSTIGNTGDITVEADAATGIDATGGRVDVTHDGRIVALGNTYGTGIYAKGQHVTVGGTGDITVEANDAVGVQLIGTATAAFASGGTLDVQGATSAIGALVLGGTLQLDNSGDINVRQTDADATGESTGAFGVAAVAGHDVTVGNSGTIAVQAALAGTGVYASGENTTVDNAGDITVDAIDAIGVDASAMLAATFANSGDIVVAGDASATGVELYSTGTGAITNAGRITATSGGDALGVFAYGPGALSITSTGRISATSTGTDGTLTAGIYADGGSTVAITNGGAISATGTGDVVGVAGYGLGVSVVNTGRIDATATDGGYAGGLVVGSGSQASVSNGGTVVVAGDAGAVGIALGAQGNGTVTNTGRLQATSAAGAATGVLAGIGSGQLVIDNRGSILATGVEAIGVDFASAGTLLNSGSVRAVQDGAAGLAVRGDDAVQDVRNTGTLDGAIDLGGGDDRFTNMAAGLWRVSGEATDFGAGDDALRNMAGATILLTDGTIGLGASRAGNSFLNEGLVRVAGVGIIDMGRNAAGTGANALAFTNNGRLAMDNGAANDRLEILGDLAGQGRVAIDLSTVSGTADQLVVSGSMAANAVQTVDVSFDRLPGVGMQPVAFAHIGGTSAAGNFVAGEAFLGGRVVGYQPSNFVNLSVNVTSQITAGEDVFSVALDVAGLSDSGQLAATALPGMLRLADAQVGTWRERMGLNPELGDDRVGLGPWVRTFADHGNVRATQVAGNFDQGGALDFRQANHGTEVGFDAHLGGGLHAGVLMGKSYGSQRSGTDGARLESGVSGLYATWFSPAGVYVDASYRWMDFTADLASAGGMQRTRGDAGAFNVEAGWTAWQLGRVALTPQLQYTQSRVGNIDVLQAPQSEFAIGDSESRRARVGVEASGSFEAGAVRWTPYAAVSAVREFDGEASYGISDTLFATTSTKGTSAKVDLGAGAQFGGISVAGGVNWTDGGAMRDVVGGQLVLRYTW